MTFFLVVAKVTSPFHIKLDTTASFTETTRKNDPLYVFAYIKFNLLQDLEILDPGRGKFLAELQQLASQKHNINIDNNLTQEEKEEKVS